MINIKKIERHGWELNNKAQVLSQDTVLFLTFLISYFLSFLCLRGVELGTTNVIESSINGWIHRETLKKEGMHY